MAKNCCVLLGVVCLTLALSGCGFQLRGTIDLPNGIEPIFIRADEPLLSQLQNTLAINGVALADRASDANHQLSVGEQRSDSRILSLAEDARVAEYQLTEWVTISIRNRQGETVFGPVELRERAILRNNPDQIVSTGRERRLLQEEMQRNMADKVARQLTNLPPLDESSADATE